MAQDITQNNNFTNSCTTSQYHSLRPIPQPIKDFLLVSRQPVNIQADFLKCLWNWTNIL